jgi:hypothetical protein
MGNPIYPGMLLFPFGTYHIHLSSITEYYATSLHLIEGVKQIAKTKVVR